MATLEEFRGNRFWHFGRPKDPACADIGLVYVQIVHGNGKLNLDLNALSMMAWTNDIAKLEPAPGVVSVVTGDPGVLFRMHEAQVGLAPAEADRMAKHSLTPEEFFAICDAVGSVWLTHDDFYDPHTGVAYPPMRV